MSSSRISSIFNRSSASSHAFRSFMHWPFKVLVFATWIPAAVFFNDHVGDITWVTGASMYPYLNSSFNEDLKSTICWTRKWEPTRDLKRGMIVSFRSPTHPEYKVIKRVIAKEGDTVITRAPCPVPTVQIPRNHIWVEGDNRDPHKTLDSNTYGPIPLNLVDGRITYVLSPWKSFGPVRWDDFKGRTKVIKGRPGQAPGW